ncbi:MAG: metal ABC transporter permease, partial [Hydrogenophaga sp.]|nr:metal ABC transporter permease [Hydrogenophaga sp.]
GLVGQSAWYEMSRPPRQASRASAVASNSSGPRRRTQKRALGTLMAVGIMVLPAATARFWVRRLGPLLLLATALALLACLGGLLISYHADWPTSPVIVLTLGATYLLSLLFAPHGALRHQRPASSHLQA